jgi:hypothetical protein
MTFCLLQLIASCENFVDVLKPTNNRKLEAQEGAARTIDSKSGLPFQ